MQKACPGPSPELRANVPRITQMKIDPSFIGKLIGESHAAKPDLKHVNPPFALRRSLCVMHPLPSPPHHPPLSVELDASFST